MSTSSSSGRVLAHQQESLLRWLNRNQRMASFGTAVCLFFLLHIHYDVQQFRYDAGGYWNLSSLVLEWDYPSTIRGYFYPALLSPLRFLSDSFPLFAHLPFRLASSVLYSIVLTIMLPSFYTNIFGGNVTYLRRLIVPSLVCLIFPGVIIYPLSDLASIALLLGSIWFIRQALKADGMAVRFFLFVLSGLFCYGAYNTRTIFIFSLVIVLFFVFLLSVRRLDWRYRAYAPACFLIGAIIASAPQVAINMRHYALPLPTVITDIDGGKSLFARQLLWGITLQRYETSIAENVSSPSVFYLDEAGVQFFRDNEIDAATFEVADYLRIMVVNPLHFAGLLGRHFVNGLDVRDGEVYIQSPSAEKTLTAFLNFGVVFVSVCVAAAGLFRKYVHGIRTAEAACWAAVFLIPVVAILPGAIETRFFLPLHLALYSTLAFRSDPLQFFSALKNHWVLLTVAFGLSAMLFFGISTTTMSGLSYKHPF